MCDARDLKPENFLLSSKAEDAPLKGCDFGLSVFYRPGEVFQDIVGSAYYVAPEVRPLLRPSRVNGPVCGATAGFASCRRPHARCRLASVSSMHADPCLE